MRILLLSGLFVAVVLVSLFSFKKPAVAPEKVINERLVLQSDSFLSVVNKLKAIPADAANSKLLQQNFLEARLAYKKIEWATEYFDPLTGKQVNGPPVPETELSGITIQPEGLQVIEDLLYPRYNPSSKKQLAVLLGKLQAAALEFKAYFKQADLENWQIFDACRLEVFRVETLGLNRFDDPLSGNCFHESAMALSSVQQVMNYYVPKKDHDLNDRFKDVIKCLSSAGSFNGFDRSAFLLRYANPLTRSLARLKQRTRMTNVRYNRLLNQDAATLFDSNAFNRNAYIAAPEDSVTPLKIALGKKLFFDKILSGSLTRSCSSCHQPEKTFTDGLGKNTDITGRKFIARNTPTLINAALQPAQFYDMRSASLEDQVEDVVQNKTEMHGDMQLSTTRLWKNDTYRSMFKSAYPQKERKAIDTMEVMNAISSYIRSLTALNSRFDAYMQGDVKAMSGNEVKGFNLFMGKARCSTCHYMPLFNGTLPPRYVQMDAEVIGVPLFKTSKLIDPDKGRYNIVHEPFILHAFKTPSVRNAARTAPYMHNGVFSTLEEVIDFYNKGGGIGIGIKISNQTLPAESLHLTAIENKQLVAFIKALNSKI